MLCERCRAEIADHGIRLMIHGVTNVYPPDDILYGLAHNKGITYTLNTGETAFEYHTLADLCARHPLFVQVARNAFVRRSAITALVYRGTERLIELAGGVRVSASRRQWRAHRRALRALPGVRRVRE